MLGVVLALLAVGQADWTDYDEADLKLGAAYSGLMANTPPADRLKVRVDERAWIARRNTACGREAKNSCSVRFTKQRTAELEAELGRTAWYRTLTAAPLLQLERTMDEQCRGGPSQDPDGPICARRDAVVRRLEVLGWCYGPDDAESNADRQWMRAGPRCRPYRDPE